MINDAPYMGIIREGQIKTVLPADGIEAVTVSVNRDQWPDIYYIEQPVTVEIEKNMRTRSPRLRRITDLYG